MTSPLRGPAPHPRGRGQGARAARAGEWLNRSARRDPEGRPEHGGPVDRRPESSAGASQQPPTPAASREEEALLSALAAAGASRSAVRYRGFVLLPQPDLGWLVRPERSPMTVLPFRTPPISLCDVKALVDWRLDGAQLTPRRRR